MANLKIIEEPNVIDDHFLDIIGKGFNFDHPKGLSEWLKNSIDAYIRNNTPDSDQHIILRFRKNGNGDLIFEMIDFVGMTNADIEKAFKRWGDPEAAKRGSNKQVHGGHGNGGKFYMRQSFKSSHFVTYRNGQLSIFGFNERKKYGFAEDYKNKKIAAKQALQIAEINNINFPNNIKNLILNNETGFTVVRGIKPKEIKGRFNPSNVLYKFKNHPQSRRILSRINFWVAEINSEEYYMLRPDNLNPLPGFENPRIIKIPEILHLEENEERNTINMENKKYKGGQLIIKTSEEAFGKGSRSADLNRIDIIGKIGTIASYPLHELGVMVFPQASFLYGECKCPILEDPEMDSVKNDRDKLVPNLRSKALLNWIRQKVDQFAEEIANKERKEQQEKQRKISATYNDFLNTWKDKFMSKVMTNIIQPGKFTGDGVNKITYKKNLEVPKNGLEFSYPEAKIALNKKEALTLKASVPKPFPIGSVITLKNTNTSIELEEKEITIKVENIKYTNSGEMVAVLDVFVVGRKIKEKGNVIASAGKEKTEILLEVVEGKRGDKSKKAKYPQVLLSGISKDPLEIAPGGNVILGERDPVIYQRPQDVNEGIYWINIQSPWAKKVIDFGDSSPRWRDYLLQRYIDIFVKEALYELQKKDPDNFRAESVDNKINDLIKQVHQAAIADLEEFLFDEEFEPIVQPKSNKD